ncbi:MAG: hypothetical protein UY56_C0005G0041 [Parcubacteria group bacterium GW2011_GWA1_50_14]|nr:MAG: hypothetical protein UY56_C0005G0041 [Parcubacteria group bacterium GW2011_GWA1_50_14]
MGFEDKEDDNKQPAENSAEDSGRLPNSDYHKPPKTEKSVGEHKEEKDVDFSSAEDWEELFRQIGEKGYIRGSRELFSPEELRDRIDGVRKGIYRSESITRAGNLRETVEKLVEKDEKESTKGNKETIGN